ncbi:ROK family protein [Vandammella animalimorsus]|uniref:ROK family protein n=1 Tax=Vandammella animalimorsus TaxID=2029117 RepID=UPI00325B0575
MIDMQPKALLNYRIGIDVGGTKIEGVVLDKDGNECIRLKYATPRGSYSTIVQRIVDLYKDLSFFVGNEVHTLGIGTPGSISPTTGLLRSCNATQLNGHPLHRELERRIGKPFAIENDANCFALAEAQLGAAKEYEDVLALVLGTGVGAGLIVRGHLVSGRNRIAGEWGHMVLDPQGPQCYCGRRGCVESYLSGPALERQYTQITGQKLSTEQIVHRAQFNDQDACRILDHFTEYFAQAVASAVALVDPQTIVIGGGLASIDALYTKGAHRLRNLVFSDFYETPILRNQLGNSAGVIGAAMIGI